MGSYDNQSIVLTPEGKPVGIDNCILAEIEFLWSIGITTIESCCGHNIAPGSITVHEIHIDRMKALGYKALPLGENIFSTDK